MKKFQIQNNTMFLIPLLMAGLLILSLLVFASSTHKVTAAGKFTIDARINLKKLDNPQKLKVIASANGDTQVKNVTGNDLILKALLFYLNSMKKMTLLV